MAKSNLPARIDDINAEILSWKGDLAATISPDVDIDYFIAAVTTALTLNPDIVNKCTPDSIKNACIKAAYDGLRPDGKEGALIAYGDVATWMPMVYGVRKKAKKHDGIIITAEVVYKNDKFLVLKGDDDRIEHEPAPMDVDPGAVIASYAIFKKDGEVLHRETMRRMDIDAVRNASKSKNSPAWSNWFGEMAKKAAVNRGAKSVPMSDAVRRVIERDNDLYDLNQIPGPARSDIADRFTPRLEGSRGDGFNADNVSKQVNDTKASGKAAAKKQTTIEGSANGTSQKQPDPEEQRNEPEPDTSNRLVGQYFLEYNDQLSRVNTSESLAKAKDKFWESKGGRPTNRDDIDLAKVISTAHDRRVKGEIELADITENVQTWVNDSYGIKL